MSFSIEKYMGRWYQQYALPSWFDTPGAYNVRADYELLENGEVRVVNTCETDTEEIVIEGRAKVLAPYTLAVDFGYSPVIGANYIITLGMVKEVYCASIVTDAQEESLFVLTRNKNLTPVEEYSLLQKIEKRWDLRQVQRTLQK